MEKTGIYERYPIRIIILSNLVSFAIYGLGILIISQLGLAFSFLYLLFILLFEYRLLRYHCSKCYYWGKVCGFGKGKLSGWIFKKENSSKFCNRNMTWKDLIPDILISLIPFISGVILLTTKFNFMLLTAMLLLVFFTTFGNSFIRGNLVCKHCKQKELGCPADVLFNKKNINACN